MPAAGPFVLNLGDDGIRCEPGDAAIVELASGAGSVVGKVFIAGYVEG